MTKLSKENIVKSDIEEYISEYSDFVFELKVFKKFSEFGFNCEHSGTYVDPITNKIRQFDITAKFVRDNLYLLMAVECKNIRKNFPIVTHCVKRSSNESYHYTLSSSPTGAPNSIPPNTPWVESQFHKGEKSIYKSREFVAKSLDQVGRHFKDKNIINSDSGVFEKMAQSINSSFELLKYAIECGEYSDLTAFVLPVLVVPDNTLWQINYDEDKNIYDSTDKISFYIDRKWDIGTHYKVDHRISHMEIITYSYLDSFLSEIITKEEHYKLIFGKE